MGVAAVGPGLRIAAAGLLPMGMLAVSGCTSEPLTAIACPSWVHFETPADAVEEADAVFLGTVVGEDGTARRMEVGMSAWIVEVNEVLAGDAVTAGEAVRVVSMADPCSGEAVYDSGDPLDAVGEELLLFTDAYAGERWTLTPYQGVLPAPADGAIPEEWPAP